MKISSEYFINTKKVLNVFLCIFLLMSIFFFIYWLVISMQIIIPPSVNAFFMFFNNFVEKMIKDSPVYDRLILLIPIIVSFIFIALTYVMSCLSTYVDTLHRDYLEYKARQKKLLEETINRQLREAFITEISKSNYLLIKLKISVKERESYLYKNDAPLDTACLEKSIITKVIQNTTSPFFSDKGVDEKNAYFIVTNISHSDEALKAIVNNSIDVINKNMTERASISFYCAAELYDNKADTDSKMKILEKMLGLGLKNKIIVQGNVKTYFMELHPEMFTFRNAGEYNIEGSSYKSAYTPLYSLQRKFKD